ncbi:MRN complex-interacting protein isoform X1 [Clarias gariepinus]|uniref:MRN complex-interacting protein isoform X1 n=1 Tax=Clarias gariepinus TaxID=13013 RepID=UPI00234C03F5|nr:MRN complex-interacting protein isoform X1 [Clarias gariepinus]
MGQEFHVVRCFSCQTFQVQQVKKSKKWSCKMCGEKQSLIKEYGRGTGADCRRHVQKLNSLRGELLEGENERARTQWQKEEECEVEIGPEDGATKKWEQKAPDVSRWNKYVDQKENGPECNEDEHEEEESVYTDKEQYRQHNNIRRKRKKSFTSGAAYGPYSVSRDDDMDGARWGATKKASQPCRHDGSSKPLPQAAHSSAGFSHTSTNQRTDALYDSPAASLGPKRITANDGICSKPRGANKEDSAKPSAKPQPFTPSFSPQHARKSNQEALDSKWTQFLPSVCVENNSNEYVNVDHTALAACPVMPVATDAFETTGCMSSGESEAEKMTVFEKLSYCVTGNVCKQPNSPTITSRPVGSPKPVCVQPLPIKRPCPPAFSFSTLFHTDEDFDDTY